MWEYRCNVVRIIDGDTLDIHIDLGFDTHRIERVRLDKVDTPERGDPGWAEATAFTAAWCDTHRGELVVRSRRPRPHDKYGRYLATVAAGNDTLNDALLAAGLARVYPA